MNDSADAFTHYPPYDLVVIGAGVAGLACALAAARGGLRVAVVDRRPEAGGVARSRRQGEWLLEEGPNSFTSSPPRAGELAREVGLGPRMQERRLRDYARFLWDGQQLQPVPMGPVALATTPLLPFSAKMRLLMEPLRGGPVARATEDPGQDITLGTYLRGHLGDALVDTFVVPLISGIYAADPDKVSLRAVIPKLFDRVQGSRSMVLGAIFGGGKAGKKPQPKPAGPRQPRRLISFDEGLQSLPRAMDEALLAAGADRYYGCGSLRLHREEAGTGTRWLVDLTRGGEADQLEARRVVLALPAWGAADCLREVAPDASRELNGIVTNTMLVAHLGVRRGDLATQPKGFGFLVPRRRNVRILGCLFSSAVFTGRAPEGHELLTCFMGGELDPEAVELTDDQVLDTLRADLGQALGWLGTDPALFQTTRWKPCLPVYRQGHPHRVARIRQALPRGIHLAGNYLDAISMPDTLARAEALGNELAGRGGRTTTAPAIDDATPTGERGEASSDV